MQWGGGSRCAKGRGRKGNCIVGGMKLDEGWIEKFSGRKSRDVVTLGNAVKRKAEDVRAGMAR